MTLAERLSEHVRACFTGLWIQSFEHDDAVAEIARLCRQQGWSLAIWDIDQGLRSTGTTESSAIPSATDPLAAIRSLASLASPDGTALLVLRNFHRFLGSAEIVNNALKPPKPSTLRANFSPRARSCSTSSIPPFELLPPSAARSALMGNR